MFPIILTILGVTAMASMAIPGDDENNADEQDDSPEREVTKGLPDGFVPDTGTEDRTTTDSVLFNLTGGDMETQEIPFDALPLPLEDWSQDSDLPVVNLDHDAPQPVHLSFDADMEGTLYVLEANYEQTYLSDGKAAVDVRTGWNVYFVPKGNVFPDKYDWAEDGATLYQSETFESDAEDFGDTRLVLRIDSGSYGFLESGDGELLFDSRVGTPILESNLPIIRA